MAASRYFVDRTREVEYFYRMLGARQVTTPLVKVVGPSGVGKSALLHELHAICSEVHAPAVFIYGDKNRSIASLLKDVVEQLGSYCFPFTFREFHAVLRETYHIQDLLLSPQKEAIGKQMFGPLKLIGRGITTAVSTAAGADILLAAVSEVIGGVVFDGIQDHLNSSSFSGLTPKQIALLHDLGAELLKAFKCGFARIQDTYRVTFLIDGIEKSGHLEPWMAKSLIPAINDQNTIFVLSSRTSFGPSWQELSSHSTMLNLAPFSLREVNEYLSRRSLHVSRQAAKAVFDLTDGLPLSLALWSEFSSAAISASKESFTQERTLFVADQIEQHLLSLFPDQQLKSIVHICAAMHHFDEDLLAHILGSSAEETEVTYQSLSYYTSVFRAHASGLAVHELLRRYLVDNFRRRNKARYLEVIRSAADYFCRKLEQSEWSSKGTYAVEYIYYTAILEDQRDLLTLFFNEYGPTGITVMAARHSDIPQILNVDWKAFPHEENRITLDRLTHWFEASPDSFRVAKDDHNHILGYSCILKLTRPVAQAILDGALSFKDIREEHIRAGNTELGVTDYMLDSLALADQKRVDVGAALLRDMLLQVQGGVNRLLSVAVTRKGASLLQRTGFKCVRVLPEQIDGFNYEVYQFDLSQENTLLARVLRRFVRRDQMKSATW